MSSYSSKVQPFLAVPAMSSHLHFSPVPSLDQRGCAQKSSLPISRRMSAEGLEVLNVQKETKEDGKETTPMIKLKKDKVRKKENPKIRQEVVGDKVKFLCDKCGYKGPSKKSVKMHMGKKHRGEKRVRGAEDLDGNDSSKRAKPEEDNADETMESVYGEEENDSDDEE